MRIGNTDDVDAVTFKHKGNNLTFRRHMNPEYYNFFEPNNKEEIIEFTDLTEVDDLISMLKRFKKESLEYIGIWDV